MKATGWDPSIMKVISAIAGIVLGVVIILHPFGTISALWKFTGIVLIVEGVLDGIGFALSSLK